MIPPITGRPVPASPIPLAETPPVAVAPEVPPVLPPVAPPPEVPPVVLPVLGVLPTLVPLLVAGAVTLEICVLIGLPLNFANIVAMPLLLGIGVAFKIYYVVAWRSGRTNLLQTSLTRAIFFSALTTATAFGSLWLSSHPGTSSMGKLLALSLVTTLAAVLLFQPALMGKPRDIAE